MYGPYDSAEATRRYLDLAFRDCHTALDLTVASGGFWRRRTPPGLAVTTNAIDPRCAADLHLDFTATGLPDESYDLVIYDPPHLADCGAMSIMGRRFGSATTTDGLDALVTAGVREAWRIARVGLLVKLADSSHGGEYLQLSRWVADQFDARPYFVAHTTRSPLEDGKWKVQRVPRSNGAVYLVWRKAGHEHRDFDALYERQQRRETLRCMREQQRMARCAPRPKRCGQCNAPIAQNGDRPTLTCSSACRQRAYRQRAREAHHGREAPDGSRLTAVGQAPTGPGVRGPGPSQVLTRGLRRRVHRGTGGASEHVVIPAGTAGVAVG